MGVSMLLRNKKTGKLYEWCSIMVKKNRKSVKLIVAEKEDCKFIVEDDGEIYYYESFDKMCEEWETVEDPQPKEPLIENKKARNVFREWAEINDIKTVLVCESFNSWGFKNKNNSEPGDKEYMGADLLFRGKKPEKLEFGKEYTIPELCGEEEK